MIGMKWLQIVTFYLKIHPISIKFACFGPKIGLLAMIMIANSHSPFGTVFYSIRIYIL